MAHKLFKYSAWGFIIFIIISATYMGWVIHPIAEDLNTYWSNPELLTPLGEPIPPFSSLVENMVDSYMNDNGRFVNNSDILLTALCPKWSWAIADFLFLSVFFLLVYKIATLVSGKYLKGGAPEILLLMGIMALLFIPWNDYLFLQRYTTPYVWGAVWMMAFAYPCLLIWRGRRFGKVAVGLLCLCGFICGGWHEGFSLSLLCGLVPLWLMAGRECRCRLALPLVFLLIGAALNVFAPGQFARIDGMGLALNPFNWFQPKTLTGGVWLWPHIIPMLLYLSVVAVMSGCGHRNVARRVKNVWRDVRAVRKVDLPLLVIVNMLCVCVVLATLALQLFVVMPRVGTPGLVFSMIGLLSLAIACLHKIRKENIRIGVCVVSLVLASMLSVNIAFNIAAQLRLSDDHRKIEALLAESDDGQVFYDPMEWPHASHYPWQWTINHYYVDGVPLHFILVHPSNKRNLPLRLIPTSLARIPISVKIDGITFLGKEIVSDSEPEYTCCPDGPRTEIFPGEYPYMKINARVKTVSGKEVIRFFEVIPFTTSEGAADERELYYFRPIWRSWEDVADPTAEILSVLPAKYW